MHAAWEIKTVADVKKEFEMQISSCEVVGPREMFLLFDVSFRLICQHRQLALVMETQQGP